MDVRKLVWRNEKNNRHTWAFVYFCRRLGDKAEVNYSCFCFPRKKFCEHPVNIHLTRRE